MHPSGWALFFPFKSAAGEMVRQMTYLSEGCELKTAHSAAHVKLLILLVHGWHVSEGGCYE